MNYFKVLLHLKAIINDAKNEPKYRDVARLTMKSMKLIVPDIVVFFDS